MASESPPAELPDSETLPDPETLSDTFEVYEINTSEEDVRYYGEPVAETEQVVQRIAPVFRQRGYRVSLQRELGEHVLVARERSLGVDGIPWLNVILAVLTVLSTLYAGTRWYGLSVFENPMALVQAWPFAVSALGILAVHEFGHYVMSRYHAVEASLPYFLPFPNVLGTLGAVIRMNDHIPNRKALFDIGVAGPLAGLAATVLVTAIGVTLPPVEVTGSIVANIELGYPLLLQGIALVMSEPLQYADPALSPNPVVIGGWVGTFVTFLNLLPVGQLDGAHVLRALVGERLSTVQLVVPLVLFGLAGYLIVFESGRAAGLWAFWGILTLLVSRIGSATPLDEMPLGPGRRAVGVLTFILGLLCFVPVPLVITV